MLSFLSFLKKKIYIDWRAHYIGPTNSMCVLIIYELYERLNDTTVCPRKGGPLKIQTNMVLHRKRFTQVPLFTYINCHIVYLNHFHKIFFKVQWEVASFRFLVVNRKLRDIILSNRFPNNKAIVYRRYLWILIGTTTSPWSPC